MANSVLLEWSLLHLHWLKCWLATLVTCRRLPQGRHYRESIRAVIQFCHCCWPHCWLKKLHLESINGNCTSGGSNPSCAMKQLHWCLESRHKGGAADSVKNAGTSSSIELDILMKIRLDCTSIPTPRLKRSLKENGETRSTERCCENPVGGEPW